jgi:hypothetical protein
MSFYRLGSETSSEEAECVSSQPFSHMVRECTKLDLWQAMGLLREQSFLRFWHDHKGKALRHLVINVEDGTGPKYVTHVLDDLASPEERGTLPELLEIVRQYRYWSSGKNIWPIPKLPNNWLTDREFTRHCR